MNRLSLDKMLNDKLIHITNQFPEPYRVRIKLSSHFTYRLKLRSSTTVFDTMLEILACVDKNYPLILYYSKLDGCLPERGRLESDTSVICGDIINDCFVLRTYYKNP